MPFQFKNPKAAFFSQKGDNHYNSQRYFEAISMYKSALNLEKNAAVYNGLALSYMALDDFKNAIIFIDSAILISDSFSPFHGNRGLIFYRNSDYLNAIESHSMAIVLDSSSWINHANLALAQYANGDFSEACNSLRKSLELGNKNLESMQGIDKKIVRKCNQL